MCRIPTRVDQDQSFYPLSLPLLFFLCSFQRMTTKRRRSDDDGNDGSSSSMGGTTETPPKASNTGKNMDLVSMTQRLLSFGQSQQLQLQLQQRKDLNNSNGKALDSCWSCQKSGTNKTNQTTVSSNCNHCSKPICGGCIQPCCCCGQDFCSVCSIYDYSEYATRSVCLDCSR